MTPPAPPAKPASRQSLRALRRLRWAVRATLLLGVAASVVANVLHAAPHPISQAIAAWPSLALLLTVELLARIPVTRAGIAVARLLATAVVAAIAAWVSYWHMAGVAARYGETGITPYLLPVSVDGLIVIASISLLEISARIRAIEASTRHALAEPDPLPTRPVPADTPVRMPPPSPTAPPAAQHDVQPVPPGLHPTPSRDPHTAPSARQNRPASTPAAGTAAKPETGHVPPLPPVPAAADPVTPPADDRPPADTAAAVAYWRHKQPHLQAEEIGRLIGKSARTVYRHLPKTSAAHTQPTSRRSSA